MRRVNSRGDASGGQDNSSPASIAADATRTLAEESAARLGMALPNDRFEVRDGYLGAGYGVATAAMREAVATCARLEGILLELRPAGLSARFCAFALDWLIRSMLFYAAASVSAISAVTSMSVEIVVIVGRVYTKRVPRR